VRKGEGVNMGTKTDASTYGGLSQAELSQFSEGEIASLIQTVVASCPPGADVEAVVGLLLRNRLKKKA
jgi:hypothetical protein